MEQEMENETETEFKFSCIWIMVMACIGLKNYKMSLLGLFEVPYTIGIQPRNLANLEFIQAPTWRFMGLSNCL